MCSCAQRRLSLQELAVQALGERRWRDASVLFRKAEDTWDLAAERCTGNQSDVAARRRDQSEIDGQNAELCAPLFHMAREHNQKFRASSASLVREDKQEALMLAETMWREALAQCKGSAAKDSASNNANALARERGTPFVARPLPAAFAAVGKPVAAPASSAKATVQTPATMTGSKGSGTPSAPTLPATSNALSGSALASAFSAAFPTLAGKSAPPLETAPPGAVSAAVSTKAGPPVAPELQPENFTAGGMQFNGKFVRDTDSATFSGTGKLAWPNGDTFDGTLVKGARHGKGLFIWANGQRYDGDWVNDQPVGEAKMQFANGNRYEGTVAIGTPQGKGHMAYASGDTFTGGFSAGVPHGKGLYAWKNGQQFDGDWVEGRPRGKGKLTFASGDRFEGSVQDGVPNGEGRFIWTNGDQYSGNWQSGKKHGQGTFTWKNGDFWQGLYENDQQSADGKLVQK